MAGDKLDTPKQVRVCGKEFDEANEIFKKSGFTFSEVVRMLIARTIKEGRVPRSLSSREDEAAMDKAQQIDAYMDDVLGLVGISDDDRPASDKMFAKLFGPVRSDDMNSEQLREWAAKTGLPDMLQISTLADLYDHGPFVRDPWSGACDAHLDASRDEDTLVLMEDMENIRWNLENTKNTMVGRAVKFLLEFDNPKQEQ